MSLKCECGVTYVGIADAADQLGLAQRTLANYRERGYLPEPAGMIGKSPAWDLVTLLRWRERTQPEARVTKPEYQRALPLQSPGSAHPSQR